MPKEKKHKKDKKHKKEKKHKKKSKRRHSSSSPEPSSKRSRPSLPSVDEAPAKRSKPALDEPIVKQAPMSVDEAADYSVPLPPGFTPAPAPMAPMTKEQWEAKQSHVRRVVDPETGRSRLIRGEGEIIEECVSKSRQKEINKIATKADGDAFQKGLTERFKKS